MHQGPPGPHGGFVDIDLLADPEGDLVVDEAIAPMQHLVGKVNQKLLTQRLRTKDTGKIITHGLKRAGGGFKLKNPIGFPFLRVKVDTPGICPGLSLQGWMIRVTFGYGLPEQDQGKLFQPVEVFTGIFHGLLRAAA